MIFVFCPTCRIHKEDIESEFQRELKKVKEAKEEAQKQEELRAQMENFLKVR